MKPLFFVPLALLCLSVFSCRKNTDSIPPEITTTAEDDYSIHKTCTELYPEDVTARGATIKNLQWPNKSTLKVSLNGGTSLIKSKVILYAKEWEKYASIRFDFVQNDNTAPIRVEFKNDGTSWSYIGTYAKRIDTSKPTMHFGWFTDRTSNREFSRTVVHEFGHALGMIHEHQQSNADIPWDKQAVYDYYYKYYKWSKSTVNTQIFYRYSKSYTNSGSYDKASIMHYPVDESLTIGDFSIGWNTVLSEIDKDFISSVYPN